MLFLQCYFYSAIFTVLFFTVLFFIILFIFLLKPTLLFIFISMTKIAIVMKSNKPLVNIDDENLDVNTLTAVLNSNVIDISNFFYYQISNDESIQNVVQNVIYRLDHDVTHLIYLGENMVLDNLVISTQSDDALYINNENIDKSKIAIFYLSKNADKNMSNIGHIEINEDLTKCCLESDSIEVLCKKIIGSKIDFTECLQKIREKCIIHNIDTFSPTNIITNHKPSIFIGTPCFGAQVSCNFTRSLIATIELLKSQHINVIVHFLPNQIVTRARNLLADYFLKSHCSHLLFIDADIEWKPEDVVKLIRHDKELGVGLYANKAYVGIKKDPNLFKNIQYSSTFFDNGHTMTPNNLLEIKHGATGFMLIKRCVFDTIREKTDEFLYSNVKMNDYFPCKVVDNDYLTEDYAFCQMWRETGGKVWADMSICLNHEGWHSYPGNPLATYSVDQKSVSSTKN